MTDIEKGVLPEIPHLRRFARALVHSTTTADDLTYDCIAHAIRHGNAYQPGIPMRVWLLTQMVSVYFADIWKYKVATKDSYSGGRWAEGPDTADRDAADARDLQRRLVELPDEQRVVILLVALQGLSYEDTSRITGYSVDAVRSHLSRARIGLSISGADSDEKDSP